MSYIQDSTILTHSSPVNGDSFGIGTAVSSNGLVMAVGASGRDLFGSNDGSVFVYDFNTGSNLWVQRGGELSPSDAGSNKNFGSSVALSSDGTILAVGSDGSSFNKVYFYDWSGSAWVERSATITGGPHFGCSLALSDDGSVLVVGNYAALNGSSVNTGSVKTYDWSGSAWVLRGSELFPSDGASADNFGISVALSGDGNVLFVGAYGWEGTFTAQGGVYIYDRSGSAWTQRGSVLTNSDAAVVDFFGYSVASSTSGTKIAIGAINKSSQGRVYIYLWNGSTWNEEPQILSASDATSGRNFGSSVAFSSSGDLLEVGDTLHTSSRGAVYKFDIVPANVPSSGSFTISGSQPTIKIGQVPAPSSGSSVITGHSPTLPIPAVGTPSHGSLVITGHNPGLPVPAVGTPSSGSIIISGHQPFINFSPLSGSLVITGHQPTLPPPVIFIGQASLKRYSVTSAMGDAFLLDGGAELRRFNAQGILGGFLGKASLRKFNPQGLMERDNEFNGSASLRSFSAQGSFEYPNEFIGKATLRTFNGQGILGGFIGNASIRRFDASATSEVYNFFAGDTAIRHFDAQGVAGVYNYFVGRADIRRFGIVNMAGQTEIRRFSISGTMGGSVNYSAATVMNATTTEVSRYTDFAFSNIITVKGVNYGVKDNGLYKLTGTTDYDAVLPTEINSSITTKSSDFGTFQSKRCAYVYLNSDTETRITPIVDDVEKSTYASLFGGRKCHLGRGLSGRYWAFKIENIVRLEGIEPLPELGTRQRRVK